MLVQAGGWGDVSDLEPRGEMYCEAHTRAMVHLDVEVVDSAAMVAALLGAKGMHVCCVHTPVCAACMLPERVCGVSVVLEWCLCGVSMVRFCGA